MANKTDQSGSVSIKLDSKTIMTILAFLFGIGGLSVGGYTITKDVPTQTTVDESTEKLINELKLLRGDVRELRGLRLDVQNNQDAIKNLQLYQMRADSTVRTGFGVLWEQQNMLLKEIGDIRSELDTLNENPFYP